MSIVQYKPNEKDRPIIEDITSMITEHLNEWYGEGASLEHVIPSIHSYRNCFMLRYPLAPFTGKSKTVLVKIRRNPKMDSLFDAINAEIHGNIPTEYHSLEFVFGSLDGVNESFGVIRPLAFLEKYHAILMEEYPSRTLRQLLTDRRSKATKSSDELQDAAQKTGQWLYYFHHHIHTAAEKPYSTNDILYEVQSYAMRLEDYSRGRIGAQALLDSFSQILENVEITSMKFSQSHADMTCDNVLYSDDGRVCIIDIKTQPAPIYSDLGLILTHPETFKAQIFSGGTYLPDRLLQEYRDAILAGYFEHEPENEFLVKLYSAIKILDKWTMYEELMSRYKGVKHLLAVPAGPIVTGYFKGVLRKHLAGIPMTQSGDSIKIVDAVDNSA